MISIDVYRTRIGTFSATAQKNFSAVAKSLIIGTVLSSRGFTKLLKPIPFIAFVVYLTYAYPKSYEIVQLISVKNTIFLQHCGFRCLQKLNSHEVTYNVNIIKHESVILFSNRYERSSQAT